MGCVTARPDMAKSRGYPDSKPSINRSSHEANDESHLQYLLSRSAFFSGLDPNDLNKIASCGTLIAEGTPLKVIAGQEFILGGCGLAQIENGELVAKRKDIYGEDCFAPNMPPSAGLFSFKRVRRESASRERRESASREYSRDRKESVSRGCVQDSPLNLVRTSSRERAPSREDLSAAADSVSSAETGLKLMRLEKRVMAMFKKSDIDALADQSEALKTGLQLLASRAKFRSASGFYRSGCLSFLKPHELKMFALGFDYCTLDSIVQHSSTASSNFYYICDGSLEVTVNLASTAGASFTRNDIDKEDKDKRLAAGRIGSGSFVSETTGLLQVQKRFANKLSYNVLERGVALYLSDVALHNYFNKMFSEQALRMFEQQSKDRQAQNVRALFPALTYLSDEMLELLMEACSSTTLVPGEEVPRPQDFHLVYQGAIITSGSIRRRSIGGGLILVVPPPISTAGPGSRHSSPPSTPVTPNGGPRVGSSSAATPASPISNGGGPQISIVPAVNNIVAQGEFFSSEGIVKLFNSKTEPPVGGSVQVPEGIETPPSIAKAGNLETTIWSFPLELVSLIMTKEPVWAVDLEIRALKENASIEAILCHPVGAHYFRINLESFHADENLDFYLAARAFARGVVPASFSSPTSPPPVLSAGFPQLTPPGFTKTLSGRLRFREQPLSAPSPSLSASSPGLGGRASPPELSLSQDNQPPMNGDSHPALSPLDSFALYLFHEYIDEGAPRQINIASEMRSLVKQAVFSTGPVPHDTFAQAQQECLKILITDSFPRFRASKSFDDMLRDICAGLSLREVMLQSGDLALAAAIGERRKSAAAGLSSPIMAAKKRLSSRTSPSKSRPESAARLNLDMPDWSRRDQAVPGDSGSSSVSPRPIRATASSPSILRQREDSRESLESPSFIRFAWKRESSGSSTPRPGSSLGLSPNEFKRKNDPSLRTIAESPPSRKNLNGTFSELADEVAAGVSAATSMAKGEGDLQLQSLSISSSSAPAPTQAPPQPPAGDLQLQSLSISSSSAPAPTQAPPQPPASAGVSSLNTPQTSE